MKRNAVPALRKPARQAKSLALGRLRVGLLPGEIFRGRILAGTSVIPCVIGPGGMTRRKREGDGATPTGCFALRRILFRRDRGPVPTGRLPRRALRETDGWCDDPRSQNYNKPVLLPFAGRHETMWRQDRLYDLVVVIDFNLGPVRRAHGSAIFMHVAASPRRPTAGCVALDGGALRRLLGRIDATTRIEIK